MYVITEWSGERTNLGKCGEQVIGLLIVKGSQREGAAFHDAREPRAEARRKSERTGRSAPSQTFEDRLCRAHSVGH